MLGSSIKVLHQGDHLRVVMPGSIWTVLFCAIGLLFGFFLWRGTTTPRGKRTAAIWLLVVAILFGIGFTPASVDLDGASGTARVFTTTMLVPHWRTLPLADLSHARLAQADFSTTIVLTTRDGHAWQLTPYDQRGGVEEGVNAINAFLDTHGVYRPY